MPQSEDSQPFGLKKGGIRYRTVGDKKALSRIPFGIEAMQRLGESPLTDGKKSLLGDCVESYIDLPEEASRKFHAILEANATGRVPALDEFRSRAGW